MAWLLICSFLLTAFPRTQASTLDPTKTIKVVPKAYRGDTVDTDQNTTGKPIGTVWGGVRAEANTTWVLGKEGDVIWDVSALKGTSMGLWGCCCL